MKATVAIGDDHALAVVDGAAWSWGRAPKGEWARPAALDLGGEQADSVAAGHSRSLALTVQGAVFSWGQADGRAVLCPERVGALATRRCTAISCGAHCFLALDEQGKVFWWGDFHGAPSEPAEVGGALLDAATRVIRLSHGACANHFGAISEGGGLYTWGEKALCPRVKSQPSN
jgi:alpha-tubulin suppressor-like RCC1 family protein